MKHFSLIFIFLLFVITFVGCQNQLKNDNKVQSSETYEVKPTPEKTEEDFKQDNTINITVKNITYTTDLYDNETSKAFQDLLPISLEMNELNGNEKYCYLDSELPISEEYTGTIHAGDIMLYGSNCVVLFYKDFNTDYSYSRIGHIQDATGLNDVLGEGSIQVDFN